MPRRLTMIDTEINRMRRARRMGFGRTQYEKIRVASLHASAKRDRWTELELAHALAVVTAAIDVVWPNVPTRQA